ncbi:flavin-containing monooxygenase FMO GS-OX-like 2 [Olea europaea subsp. europaea]|uniref:Flavin-containing monooxygenase n=1 Tax=Olea europaea subsp. europaea TaxID=158383 RepID=A0A8S0PJR6_OLEEU|nr:flavin-containing monooxygenase FMO GS-OX-like 2 [Olea europaea subsp. europaea]
MEKSFKVAVIGAGVAGLAAARELKREGHQVVVYEKSDKLGGTWVYDPRIESDPLGLDPNREVVHGSLYSSLRTNLPRQLMNFSDYPFEIKKNGELRTFPGHEEVLEFLNEFAREFGLVELIRFNTEVVRVHRVNSQWIVESELSLEEAFDAVIVCNGHHTQPRIADIPGIEKWPGKQIHSHNYRVPEPFQDQVVVVIGDGPSAHDISEEIAMAANEVHLSSRSPEIKVTKLDYYDNIWQHPKIDCVHENGEIAFQDGASVPADIILHCTGYNYDFPFLETDGIVSVDDNRVGPLYRHVFPPKLAPTLAFIGISFTVVVFHMIEFQAKWVACVLSGKVLLPSEDEMSTDIENHYKRLEDAGKPKYHTHNLLFDEFEHQDWLAAQVGEPRLDEGLKERSRALFKFLADKGWVRFRELMVEKDPYVVHSID